MFFRTIWLAAGLAISSPGQVVSVPLGTPCPGGLSTAPLLGLSAPLSVGQSSSLVALNLPSPSTGFLVMGWDNHSWNGQSLPIDLGAFGLGGCDLHVRPDTVSAFAGFSSWRQWLVHVPMMPILQGMRLSAQAFVADPTPAASGLAATAGLEMPLGPWTTLVQSMTQVTRHGITFVFEQPVPVGQFVNGDWFVVGPCRVIDMQPPTATVGGRVMHGAMLDPDPSLLEQGYDSGLYGPLHGHLYKPTLNVGWVSPANPLALSVGQSLIKSKSLINSPTAANLQTAAVLTVVGQPPSLGAFRPPYVGNRTPQTLQFEESMLDWSVLANLTPAPGGPRPSDLESRFERVWLDHCPSWLGRMLHPLENMPDYGRDLAALYAKAALLINSDYSVSEKRRLTLELVQIGIDNYGILAAGGRWPADGGHNAGRKLPILLAGKMLGFQDMLDVGRDYVSRRLPDGTSFNYFGEDGQTFFVEETSPGVINFGAGGYTIADLGLPDWGVSHVDAPWNDDRNWYGNQYRICCTANGWLGHVLTAHVMGLVDDWNHPPLFAYTDRYVDIELSGWTRSWDSWVGAMWDLYRGHF